MVWHSSRKTHSKYSLGIDPARTGGDFTAYVILEKDRFSNEVKLIYMEEDEKNYLNEIISKAEYLDNLFNFNRIIIDSTGLGAGVFDVLKERLGGKVDDVVFTVSSKMDIFNNLKLLMQENILKIPNNKKLIYELLGINYRFGMGKKGEVDETGKMKIYHLEGQHDDLVCALALAASYFKANRNQRGYYVY